MYACEDRHSRFLQKGVLPETIIKAEPKPNNVEDESHEEALPAKAEVTGHNELTHRSNQRQASERSGSQGSSPCNTANMVRRAWTIPKTKSTLKISLRHSNREQAMILYQNNIKQRV